MTSTVLITGSSSGIGKETARYFHEKGWNVVATMRTPEKETELREDDRMLLARLDVTDEASIHAAIEAAIARFGGIDALVNNAGYGLLGTFESMDIEHIQRQFETNVFGVMRVTKAILPHFRERGGGVLINVASMGGRVTFPLYSPYHGTKWAIDGWSDSLQFELRPQNIRVKIIEPGAIKTDFYDRSQDLQHDRSLADYNEFVDTATTNMKAAGTKGAPARKVAEVIFRAATDGSWKLRYPVGSDARSLLFLRRLISDRVYHRIVSSQVLKKSG